MEEREREAGDGIIIINEGIEEEEEEEGGRKER